MDIDGISEIEDAHLAQFERAARLIVEAMVESGLPTEQFAHWLREIATDLEEARPSRLN